MPACRASPPPLLTPRPWRGAAPLELKADLRDLFINSAKEVDISSGRKAIVIHVPVRLLKAFHKVQIRLVRELEKKFSGKDVVIVANRRILPKPTTGSSIARPRSRTLTAVHAALLEDLVFPTEIVGKRTRYRTDGSKLLKVFLDPKDRCVEGARPWLCSAHPGAGPPTTAHDADGTAPQEHNRVQAGLLLERVCQGA